MSVKGSGGGRFAQDTVAGVLVILLGCGILAALSRIGGAKYQQIAPDLFPRICAILLVTGGCLLLARGILRGGELFAMPRVRGLGLVVLGVVSFGLLAPSVGYAPAGLALMIVSGLATPHVRIGQLIAVTVGIVILSVVLFSFILQLPLPAFRLPAFRL